MSVGCTTLRAYRSRTPRSKRPSLTSYVVDCRIKLTTATPSPQTYEGTIFTACPVLNLIAIDTRSADSPTQAGDYHMIPVSRIQSFTILSLASTSESAGSNNFATARPAIGPVDIKRLQDRERAKIEKLKEEEKNKGRGVSKEGQAIYDSLKRMYISPVPLLIRDLLTDPPFLQVICQCAGTTNKWSSTTPSSSHLPTAWRIAGEARIKSRC